MKAKKDMRLKVRISRATNIVWEGEANSVSSKNAHGPFDILPMHANFITLVKKEPIEVRIDNGKKHSFTFDESVIYVTHNEVKIYADFS